MSQKSVVILIGVLLISLAVGSLSLLSAMSFQFVGVALAAVSSFSALIAIAYTLGQGGHDDG